MIKMSKSKQKIFISGSGGFLGKNLIKYLKDNYILLTPSKKILNLKFKKKLKELFFKLKRVVYLRSLRKTRGSISKAIEC